jgi:hypothetical protein
VVLLQQHVNGRLSPKPQVGPTGEVVLRESPCAVVPRIMTGKPVCFSCLQDLDGRAVAHVRRFDDAVAQVTKVRNCKPKLVTALEPTLESPLVIAWEPTLRSSLSLQPWNQLSRAPSRYSLKTQSNDLSCYILGTHSQELPLFAALEPTPKSSLSL